MFQSSAEGKLEKDVQTFLALGKEHLLRSHLWLTACLVLHKCSFQQWVVVRDTKEYVKV